MALQAILAQQRRNNASAHSAANLGSSGNAKLTNTNTTLRKALKDKDMEKTKRMKAIPKNLRCERVKHTEKYGFWSWAATRQRLPLTLLDEIKAGMWNDERLREIEKALTPDYDPAEGGGELVFFRGRTRQGYSTGDLAVTCVCVVAFWRCDQTEQFHLFREASMEVSHSARRIEGRLMLLSGDERQDRIIAGEHELASKIQNTILEAVFAERRRIAKEAHENTAEYKLKALRKRVREIQESIQKSQELLEELRVEETRLMKELETGPLPF